MEDLKLNSKEFLDAITSVVPKKRQLAIQEMGYYNFIHFGLNTFTGKEWGDGKVSPKKFTVKDIDTDKWVRDLKSTGSKGVIITSKHHDGFCLFPSKYTDYTIANTKYQGGKGDIIKQLSESCQKYDFKLGIYLSPWDRHENTYGTDEYNDFFCNQLTELCLNYGEIFCFWFDGACGEGPNGKKQIYDWSRYYEVIRRLQPNACISVCGPDVRWIGNEGGKSREAEYSVVSTRFAETDDIAANSQQQAGAKVMAEKLDTTDECLGSREKLLGENLCWYPAEMDVTITTIGWFYHKKYEMFNTRSIENLKKCYYTSVGNNAMLLLNVPPNKKGEIPEKFITRLQDTKKSIEDDFANEVEFKGRNSEFELKAEFSKTSVSKVVLEEDVTKSQRVETFEIYADDKKVFDGKTIGFKKFCIFDSVKCSELTVKVTSCRNELYIKSFKIFR
ncbi:MAG: alpha-L-fucosidase [Oscillospiraceae bacterium]